MRHRLLLLLLASLALLAACSDDEPNQPPRVTIVYPDPGQRLTVSPDSILVNATDDRGIAKVDFFLDGTLISTATRAAEGGGYTTRLPLGVYADGEDHLLGSRAVDSDGVRSGTAQVTVSVDPVLQTVPQITAFADDEGSNDLRLSWLEFPQTVDAYEWEVAADDRFFAILDDGATTDTSVIVATTTEGLAYARVRAVIAGEPTGWSRASRYNTLVTWRERLAEPGSQLGTAVYQAEDGTLRILSHGVAHHRVQEAPVQLLALDADHQLSAVHELLDASYRPTAQAIDSTGTIRLAGVRSGAAGFVAAADLAGNLLWSAAADFMHCSALFAEAGSWHTVGADLREEAAGGVFATVIDGGGPAPGPTFDLESGREVLFAWPRPAGGYVVAGQLPETENGRPGGVWIRGLDASYQAEWDLRLGTGRNFLLRGGGSDGQGNFVLTGIALVEDFFARSAFILGFDADGRIRWQVTDRDWHLLAEARADAGGRWTVAGVRRTSLNDLQVRYDTGLRGFSAAGLPLWSVRHRAGAESQGWALVPHPRGGWWLAGTRTDDYADFDVDLLRVDDRGELQ